MCTWYFYIIHITGFVVGNLVLQSYANKNETKVTEVLFVFLRTQDGICDKNSAPSVSSISRLLRGGRRDESDPRKNHSIDGILGKLRLRRILTDCTLYSIVVNCRTRSDTNVP